MTAKNLIPVHQCYFLGEETVDPVHVFTSFLIRNPSYARQRHADCVVHIYVVDRPVADRLACPPSYLRKITTTMGAIRAGASAITGEDFNPQPYTAEQLAARRAKKAAKKSRGMESPDVVGEDTPA
jgi:hypothetical protein